MITFSPLGILACLGATLLYWAGYMLGFAMHLYYILYEFEQKNN